MSKINSNDYLEYLYGRLPTEWRIQDQKEGLPLYNYLKAIVLGGMEKNIELANKFTELTDPVRCPSPFFPTLYESIGLSYDQGISEVYHRRIFQNIGELMRRRGSYNSIHYLIRVLTGMECRLDYQRSPVKSYESNDLVSFQGYNRGDITVIEMKGNTEQNTTKGDNIYTITNNQGTCIKTSGGCTTICKDDGSIIIKGKGPTTGYVGTSLTYSSDMKKSIKPGTYQGYCERLTFPHFFIKVENKLLNFKAEINNVGVTSKSFTLSQEILQHPETNVYAGVWEDKNVTITPGIIRPRVLFSDGTSIPRPYEQFSNMIPSPSIEVEQYPWSVGEASRGINLLDMRNAKGGTAGGISVVVQEDGSFVSCGICTDNGNNVNIWLFGNYNITPAVDNSNVVITLEEGKTYFIQDIIVFSVDNGSATSATGAYTCHVKGGLKVTGVRHVNITKGTSLWKETYYPSITNTTRAPLWESPLGPTPPYEYDFVVSRGRRNLVHSTNQGDIGAANFDSNCTLLRQLTPEGKNGLKILVKRKADTGFFYLLSEAISACINPNTVYQMSFDIYVHSGSLSSTGVRIIEDRIPQLRVDFGVKNNEVMEWKHLEYNAKGLDFVQHNALLQCRVTFHGLEVNDYVLIQNLQLHETDLPNEWVPALEDKTAGTPNTDYVQLFNIGASTPNTPDTKFEVTGNIITVTGKSPWCSARQNITEMARGKELTISGTVSTPGKAWTQVVVQLADASVHYYLSGTFTIPGNVKNVELNLLINNSSTTLPEPITVQFTDVMLNTGKEAQPWRPYDPTLIKPPAPESVSNYFQRVKVKLSAPLRSCGLINPLRDRVVRRGTGPEYKWDVIRSVDVQTLNGTETAWEMSFVQGNYIRFALPGKEYDIAGPRMCNHLPYEADYSKTMDYENVHSNPTSGVLGITILLSRLKTSDIAGFKSWLTAHHLIVFYGRANIKTEALDYDSVKQLNTLKAYNDEHTTYIYTISRKLPGLVVDYTGFGRYLFISMLAATIDQLSKMDNNVALVQRFLNQFVPYYITPIVSGEVQMYELASKHLMGFIFTESKNYEIVQYREPNTIPK